VLQTLTPDLMVENVRQTAEWYGAVLGFETIATVPEEGELVFAMVKRDGVQFMFESITSMTESLSSLQGKPVGGTQNLYMQTTGVEELRRQVEGKADIVKDLHNTFYGTREFIIADCNGYILSFAEELTAQGE
jgi:uncharacterized glyoxalase superfamily protein PhnB